MNFRYQADAVVELFEAAAFYEGRRAGLGFQFQIAVKDAIDRLLNDPESYPLSEAGTRSITLKRFPYRIVYLVVNDTVEIYAVVHHSRRPGYWTDRLQDTGSEE